MPANLVDPDRQVRKGLRWNNDLEPAFHRADSTIPGVVVRRGRVLGDHPGSHQCLVTAHLECLADITAEHRVPEDQGDGVTAPHDTAGRDRSIRRGHAQDRDRGQPDSGNENDRQHEAGDRSS